MKYTVRYTDSKGARHQKVFTNEQEAIAAYDKLQSLKAKYRLTGIEAHDGFCFYYGNGLWD